MYLQIARDQLGQIERIDFKIIDLGMAKRFFTEKLSSEDILGTNGYHAPEMLLEDDYDLRADVFMLGITFCVMVSWYSLFSCTEILKKN